MAGAFDHKALDNYPLGAVIESAVNVERATGGKWIALDGGFRSRSAIDSSMSRDFPIGKLTATTRTAGAGNTRYQRPSVSPTYFVGPGAAGTTGIAYSSDGATWATTSVVTPASFTTSASVWTGARFVAADANGGQPYVTTGDNPNSTWTATTGATSGAYSQGLCYSPQLAMTIHWGNTANTYVGTLPDGSTTWTARTKTSSTCPYQCGVWTGGRFVLFPSSGGLCRSTHVSEDATTWSDEAIDIPIYTAVGGCASDGAGTIVAKMQDSDHIAVSKDHGRTWRAVLVGVLGFTGAGAPANTGGQYVSFANRKFWLGANDSSPLKSSYDGLAWGWDQTYFGSVNPTAYVAYKGGVYLNWSGYDTTAFTFTEDMSKFRAPLYMSFVGVSTGGGAAPSLPRYMKVRN